MNQKTLTACAILALMIAIGAYWRSHRLTFPPESEMPQILREAEGTAPIPDADPRGRRALRESFRFLVDENKKYQADADRHFMYGRLNSLMYPSSFTSAGTPQQIISELQELKELDQRHLRALQNFPEIFRKNLSSAGASAGDVSVFESAMRKQLSGGALDEGSHAIELDMNWIDAAIELYQYASENQGHISGRGAYGLSFDSEDVRLRFQEISQKAEQLGRERDQAATAFTDRQARNRSQMRLWPQLAN